jgi:hypothetical protein
VGTDKIRHLITKERKDGTPRYFWQPSATIMNLGMTAEALGSDRTVAEARAVMLNSLADQCRRARREGTNGPLPGTFSALFAAYKVSDEFAELKPRTQDDYIYYLGKVELEFGHIMVRAMTPRVIKTYYKRIRREISVTWAYGVLTNLRTILSWAVSEDWITDNAALKVVIRSPPKRRVQWKPEQAAKYIDKAREMGWNSIAVMALVFDSIGQSPIDVRTLKMRAYDGRTIAVTRAKTGVTDAPIPLFPKAIEALNEYLEANPKEADDPLFHNDEIGGEWNESTLGKKHRLIREAAKLPSELQLQDFRTTAQTEGGAAGATVDELRGLGRHASRQSAEHYVWPDKTYVETAQAKRLALRARLAET